MDRVEARIANRLEEISRVADMVERFGAEHNVPGDAVNDVNIALDEALSNIMSYGYAPGQGSEIVVRLTYRPGEVGVEHHLEGDHAVQPDVPRLVDDAHAAPAQLPQHLVAGDGR